MTVKELSRLLRHLPVGYEVRLQMGTITTATNTFTVDNERGRVVLGLDRPHD